MSDAPQRILIIHVSRIGDTLLATPTIKAIAQYWPNAEVTVAGHPGRVEILENLAFIQHTFAITKNAAPFKGWFRRNHYDLAFVFGNDEALFHYASRVAKNVVGFRQESNNINQRLVAFAGEEIAEPKHAITFLSRMLSPFKIPLQDLRLHYQVSASETSWAKHKLQHLELSTAHPLIGLQVASFPTKAFRDWPIEHFLELAKKVLQQHPNAHFLLFGGPDDTQRTSWLQKQLSEHSTLFAGKLTLRQTAALMNQLDAYVGVDTGPTHIMGALHRPMVAMYHPTSPSTVLGPLQHPCAQLIDHPAVRQNPDLDTSMSEIKVDTVFQSLLCALQHSKR